MFTRIFTYILITTSFITLSAGAALANIDLGGDPGYEAKFAVDKNICIGDPVVHPDPANCELATTIAADSPVFYTVTVTNPWGEPPQKIQLDDNFPAGFTLSSAIVCIDDAGVTISQLPGMIAPTVAAFDLDMGQTVTCTIPGEFSSFGQKTNTVEAKNNTGYAATSEVNTSVVPSTPLGIDLTVTKSVSAASLDITSGSGILDYTVTVTNNSAVPVDVGNWFQLHDKLSLLPDSVPFRAELVSASCVSSGAGTDCLDPSGPFEYGSPQILVGTMAPTNFVRWGYASGDGDMAPGGVLTLNFKVRVHQLQGLSCVRSEGANGIQNTAFFTLISSNGSAKTESNSSNNTGTANSNLITGHNTVDSWCGKGHLKVTKKQIAPSNRVAWGSTVQYYITVENKSVPAQPITIAAGGLQDWVTQGINTPPFERAQSSNTCVLPSGSAICSALNSNLTGNGAFNYSYYGQTNQAWQTGSGGSFTLNHGDRVVIRTGQTYRNPDCETVPAAPSKPIINTALVNYEATPYGALSNTAPKVTFQQSGSAVTDMKDQDACKFKATKKVLGKTNPYLPLYVEFGTPVNYAVTFENNEAARDIGTVMDAIRLSTPGYATSLNFSSSWTCTDTGGVTGYAPSGNIPVGATVSYTSTPAQGARTMSLRANPAVPLNFQNGSKLTCNVAVTVQRPPYGSALCAGGGAKLHNLALMDVTFPFNNSIHWPPSGSYDPSAEINPAPQNKNWAMANAQLPKCFDAIVNKSADVDGLSGNSLAWTYQGGPEIDYTVNVKNDMQGELNGGKTFGMVHGLIAEDAFLPPYQNVSSQGSTCSPSGFCQSLTPRAAIVVDKLATSATGNWTYETSGPFVAGQDIENCVTLNPEGNLDPSAGYYYSNFPLPVLPDPNDSSAQSDCVKVPVIRTTEVNITKEIDDQTGAGITTGGPFDFSVACSPYELFTGTDMVSINAGQTGTVKPVPVRSSCSITETSKPPVPQDAINACANKAIPMTAEWVPVSFSPSATLSGSSSNPLSSSPISVTATNTLKCSPAIKPETVELKITKQFRSGGKKNWDFTFEIDCNPFQADPTSVTMTYPDDNDVVVNVPVGSTCTVNEITPAFTQDEINYCASKTLNGVPLTPVWDDPVYTPSNQINIGEKNMRVNVKNKWTCGLPVPTTHKVCLIADNGDYVVSENDAMTVNADRKVCGPWEKHDFIDLNGGTLDSGDEVNVKTHTGKYWSAQPSGALEANRDPAGSWEKFVIVKNNGGGPIIAGSKIGLKGVHGNWVVAEGSGGQVVKADRPNQGAWETFEVEDP